MKCEIGNICTGGLFLLHKVMESKIGVYCNLVYHFSPLCCMGYRFFGKGTGLVM